MQPLWLASAESTVRRRFWVSVAAILALGAALRFIGLFDEFWLDEIWSLAFATNAKSAGQIIFGIHHDNNHHLNTLWMFLCGSQPHWFVYRLHSYFAGTATIVGAGLLAGDVAYACWPLRSSRRPPGKTVSTAENSALPGLDARAFARLNCLVTMFLLATCYYACVYSTEARGYAMSGAAAVFSTLALRRVVGNSRSGIAKWPAALTYAVLAMIGFLSNLTFAAVFVSQLIWSSVALVRQRCFLAIAVCYLPPFALLAALWFFDLRFARVGGAPLAPSLVVGIESLVLPTGAVSPDWLVLVCAAIVACGLLGGLSRAFRGSLHEASFFALLLLTAPPLMYGLRSDGLLCARHFLVVWMVLFPLLGLSLVQTATEWLRWQPIALVLPILWLATNGWEFVQFATYGRGGYERAVEWLVAEVQHNPVSAGDMQTIGSDHDFRNQMVLAFYLGRQPSQGKLTYVMNGQWPPQGVDWLFVHGIERDFTPKNELEFGNWHYDLKHVERFAAPVGWHWAIYRRRESPATLSP